MLKEEEAFFADLVYRESGIVLGKDKGYLLESRLMPLARDIGVTTLKEFHDKVRYKITPELRRQIVEALTTNETLFFRDVSPFKFLQEEVVPQFRLSKNRPVRIWCAAASTGQEPYSIVMSFLESWPELNPRDLEIIATDINTQVLDRAKNGIYNQIEINRGLPVMMLARYFSQQGTNWVLNKKIRDFVSWKILNLAQAFFLPGQFDLIFLRNVLIYFDAGMKKKILDRVASMLKPDGYLFLGATESMVGITDRLQVNRYKQGGMYYRVASKS